MEERIYTRIRRDSLRILTTYPNANTGNGLACGAILKPKLKNLVVSQTR